MDTKIRTSKLMTNFLVHVVACRVNSYNSHKILFLYSSLAYYHSWFDNSWENISYSFCNISARQPLFIPPGNISMQLTVSTLLNALILFSFTTGSRVKKQTWSVWWLRENNRREIVMIEGKAATNNGELHMHKISTQVHIS